ncbi:MAG: TolC family protein [Pirellulaceae bacterium]
MFRIVVFGMICALTISLGCTRSQFRQAADRDAYFLLGTRKMDPRWDIPARNVEANPQSRFADANCPDCGALPSDDPFAEQYMHRPDCKEVNHYDCFPRDESVEQASYLEYLPRDESGLVSITPESAIDLSLLHNRDYQSRFEQIYLSALSLSGNRFEFDTQWTGGLGNNYDATGQAPNDSRLLALSDRLGLQRNLAWGGQFATNLANSMSWQFSDSQANFAEGNVVAALTLPLLRGAARYVRLEGLIQAERDLLYQVRDFARFRRQFYLDIVSNYYGLLRQLQSIRNTRVNLESLQLNLLEHQELLAREMVSQIQVDQVFQDYQNGRLGLLSSEQSLADSLDQFKFLLGLPTWVQVDLDESLLKPFDFNSPELIELQSTTQDLYLELLAFLPPNTPSDAQYDALVRRYLNLHQQVPKMLPTILDELDAWQQRLDAFDEAAADPDDQLDMIQQRQIAKQLAQRLADLKTEIEKSPLDRAAFDVDLRETIDVESKLLPGEETTINENEMRWSHLTSQVGRRLREQLSELYVAQIQIRIFSIELPTVELPQEVAIQFARENRLDLMNQRARTVDAFRKVEVAANALKSQLDVTAGATIATDPTKANIVGFDSSANSYRVGVNLDGPLNRFNERNSYRASQIAFQNARRDFMAAEDSITNRIRSDLRDLRIQRLNFQIARQQVIAATRQVDEAQFNLRTAAQSSTNLTRDLLQALQGLLSSKNNLIGSWISYKTARIALFVDLELLYLDDQGKWVNEDLDLDSLPQLTMGSDEINELAQAYALIRSPLFQLESEGLPVDSLNDENATPPVSDENPEVDREPEPIPLESPDQPEEIEPTVIPASYSAPIDNPLRSGSR